MDLHRVGLLLRHVALVEAEAKRKGEVPKRMIKVVVVEECREVGGEEVPLEMNESPTFETMPSRKRSRGGRGGEVLKG